ncbi:bifunctional DNA primase/polymerase [Mesorhizobium sp. WSM4887]|uniref:bifunctional DNA primase/polymerase n=1 Tax=Mesorhizobium sp. WSM4887 TaxID=3038543 RepID=UPI002416EB23|nr:bifunctional DNA primase/polymerase [Mesorhizobium sp. WSM4887]MDG4890914.1 AAA family ATPase [Mesorhizobium sp. WSM4887]
MSDAIKFNASSPKTQASRVESAMWCARTIGPVFRCVRNGKPPLIEGWQREATTDATMIRKWFGGLNPPNVGIATGGPSGVIVVDLDRKDGKDGGKALAALAEAHGTSLAGSKTLTVVTPSGGMHLFYRVPAHVAAMTGNVGALGDGIDIRAAGNLVVGAGSKIDGKPYRILNDVPIADMPQWLVAAFAASKAKAEPRKAPGGLELDMSANVAAATRYLSHDAAPAIDGNGGDALTYAVACEVRDMGISEAVAFDLMLEHYNPRCIGPWEPDDMAVKVANAYAYAQNALGADSIAAHFDELPDDDDFADINALLSKAANDNGSKSVLARATLDLAAMSGQPIPERNWHVEGWIPGNNVTLLYGDGGTGKSLLTMQLAVSTAASRPWLGLPVRPGRVIYLTAEDDGDELHRRIADIASQEGLSFRDLAANMKIIPLVADDPALAVASDGDRIKATKRWGELVDMIGGYKPKLIVLDTLADVFAGNENVRNQARAFIAQLRAPAIAHDVAFVVLAHPSRAGLNTAGLTAGAGTSGSTAWHNSVRSRLELARGDEAKNPDGRTLTAKKANYSRAGAAIQLRWENGVFNGSAEATTAESEAAAREAERVFLDMLDAYAAAGRHVGAATGTSYAPAMFAKDERSGALDNKQLAAAMNRLFAAGAIEVVTSGPPSKERKHIARAAELEEAA